MNNGSRDNQLGAVGLSNRQFNILRFAQEEGGIELQKMLAISQTTAGSVVRRGYFIWDNKQELFILTKLATVVLNQFAHTDISRKNTKAPLSKYIDMNKKAKGRTV